MDAAPEGAAELAFELAAPASSTAAHEQETWVLQISIRGGGRVVDDEVLWAELGLPGRGAPLQRRSRETPTSHWTGSVLYAERPRRMPNLAASASDSLRVRTIISRTRTGRFAMSMEYGSRRLIPSHFPV